MFPSTFDYYRARSIGEAQKLWKKYPDAKLLAGGHSLLPTLKLRLAAPAALIDIGGVDALKGIAVSRGTVRIGALTTHNEIATSEDVRTLAPLLSEAAAHIGDAQVRNWGTIGGNVAHADPASDLPTVLAALSARFNLVGPNGKRTLESPDFFQGLMTTALGEQEILTSVEFSGVKSNEGTSYFKFTHPASRYAVVGAAARLTVKRGVCTAARVVVGGATAVPTRVTAVEEALVGKKEDAVREASKLTTSAIGDDLLSDVFASGEYRRAMAAVYVQRAVSQAFARAKA